MLAGYLNEICHYLENLIIDLKEIINTWKIYLSIKNNQKIMTIKK